MMKKKFNQFLIFASFGITAEIIFTSLKYNVYLPIINKGKINWILEGTSYLWMFFIYGAIPFIFPPIHAKVKHLNFLLRTLTYALVILSIEFTLGFILDITTGNCPWFYTEGITILGYIRLDYLPVWMLFGYFTERLWLNVDKA
ncbi:MAG: hypothetical protein ACHQFW_05385 [Chitinophagales bacterium]